MATISGIDQRKSALSAKSVASNDSVLKRRKSFVKPFANHDSCDHCGRGSCDNGFEGQWENGVPSVRSRTASKTEQEELPRALSRAPSKKPQVHHTRFASSQAMSSSDSCRITYASEQDDGTTLARRSASRGSDTPSDGSAGREDNTDQADPDDDEMGLAQQRRSKRYSNHKSPLSPLSPTFSFISRERNPSEKQPKSILKRESIRLSALPPIPRSGGSRRSFPAGQGMAPLISSGGLKSTDINETFVFPGPPGSDMSMRSPATPRPVTWNGLLDPDNPQNRPIPTKLLSTLLLLGLTLTVTFASPTLTPASIRISEFFDTTSEIVLLASALTLLGSVFGAPLFGALSEKYGRKRPLLFGLAIFAIFNIPVGLTSDLPTLLAFRFFAGVFGAAPLVVVPAALTDLWSPVGRGIALSFFAAISIIGPVVGAISGSYLAVVEYPGWRWTAWIAIFLSTFFGLPFALAFTESSAPLLLQRKARKLRRATRDWALHAPIEDSGAGLKAHLIKTTLLLAEPTLLLPTIHMSLACGVLSRLTNPRLIPTPLTRPSQTSCSCLTASPSAQSATGSAAPKTCHSCQSSRVASSASSSTSWSARRSTPPSSARRDIARRRIGSFLGLLVPGSCRSGCWSLRGLRIGRSRSCRRSWREYLQELVSERLAACVSLLEY